MRVKNKSIYMEDWFMEGPWKFKFSIADQPASLGWANLISNKRTIQMRGAN